MAPSRQPNRLIHATSPYLLQHAYNPVDWYPWGEEAIRKAREEDKPIFLSIGYSACHWCHVMERESFESEEIAAILNQEFVPVKVDREERPDLDEIYMAATQLLTGHGGWPMSVFLTPDLEPFYAGTYFPPEDRWRMPGFRTVLREVARVWRERREEVERQAEAVARDVRTVLEGSAGLGTVDRPFLDRAARRLTEGFDPIHGGFGGAPKFPPSVRLEFLLRRGSDDGEPLPAPVTLTLDRMARGGIYDQIGGGFHRYSVDEKWLVPHFEKMLYDNALLARLYALAWEKTGRWLYRRVAIETLDYVLREMTHPEGGFFSATDADSEGEEGRFFLWTPDEVLDVLGPEDGELFNRIYGITRQGNFEGRNIPNLVARSLDEWAAELGQAPEELDARLAAMRARLRERREARVHPARDEKILTAWNGLMIRALAEGGRIFGEERYRQAAARAAEFVLTHLCEGVDGRLLRSWKDGRATVDAYLEDYACLAVALTDLFTATGESRWRDAAIEWTDRMAERFWDERDGVYCFTSAAHEHLIVRPKSVQDSATPSAASMATLADIRAARLTGEPRPRLRAAESLSRSAPTMERFPAAAAGMLIAALEYLETWPDGVRIPWLDAVSAEGLVSHSSVQPGGRFWVAVRLRLAEGFHIASGEPGSEAMMPAELELELAEGFRVTGLSSPPAESYRPPFSEQSLSVYRGTVLIGAEVEVDRSVAPGRYPFRAIARVQPCDDRQCYPPLQATVPLEVFVTTHPGAERFPEVFDAIRAQRAGG